MQNNIKVNFINKLTGCELSYWCENYECGDTEYFIYFADGGMFVLSNSVYHLINQEE